VDDLGTILDAPIDILINNAGAVTLGYRTSPDGFETNFQGNYLGHVLLTNLLLDKKLLGVGDDAKDVRIVNVTSTVLHSVKNHKWDKEWDDMDLLHFNNSIETEIKRNPAMGYAFSKLFQLWWTQELAEQLKGQGIYVNCCDPGNVATPIMEKGLTSQLAENGQNETSGLKNLLRFLQNPIFAYKPEKASLTQLYLATSPEVLEKNISGKLYLPLARPASVCPTSHTSKQFYSWTQRLLLEQRTG